MSHNKQEVGVLTSKECCPLLGVVYILYQDHMCSFLQSKMLHAVWLEKHTTSSSPGAPAGELANYHWGCFGFLHILVGLLHLLLLLLLLSQLSLLGEVLRWALQDTFLLGNYILCALLLFLAVPFKLNQN